jgi:hypothetical protein
VLDLDLGAHAPGFRPFLVRGEASVYWAVYDGAYEPVVLADSYLRRVRFGNGMALGTRRMYAGNLALSLSSAWRLVARCAGRRLTLTVSCITWR